MSEAGTEAVTNCHGLKMIAADGKRRLTDIATAEQLDAIGLMRTPVISSIVEQLEDKAMTDETLAAVVTAIDGGATSYSGVSTRDFRKIKEARSLVNLVSGHDAFIPSYSSSTDLAKDFLMYMVTDKSLNTYMKTTKGCKLAYDYDVKTEDPELYSSFTEMQKMKLDILSTGKSLPAVEFFELNYIGQVADFNKYMNLTFCFTAPSANDRHTAQEIYQADIDHYASEWARVEQRLGV